MISSTETDDRLISEMAACVRERLSFPRGLLVLLKETELFGPLIDQALEDVDFLLKHAEALEKDPE